MLMVETDAPVSTSICNFAWFIPTVTISGGDACDPTTLNIILFVDVVRLLRLPRIGLVSGFRPTLLTSAHLGEVSLLAAVVAVALLKTTYVRGVFTTTSVAQCRAMSSSPFLQTFSRVYDMHSSGFFQFPSVAFCSLGGLSEFQGLSEG